MKSTPTVAWLLSVLTLGGSAVSAQLSTDLADSGVLREVRVGGSVLARDVRVTIPKPNWNGSWVSQRDAEAAKLNRGREGGNEVFSGTLQAAPGPLAVEEVVTVSPEEIRVAYSLTPSPPLECVGVLVMMSLPTEGHAGATAWAASDGRTLTQKLLPAELDADNYHVVHSDAVDWFGWLPKSGDGLQVVVDGRGLTGAYLQDDRKFGIQSFGIHCLVTDSASLSPGKKLTFGLTFRPLTRQGLAEAKATAAAEARDLLPPLGGADKLALRSVAPGAEQVGLYEPIELNLDLSATYDNPFDPDDVDVTARITTPSGKALTVPGFFYQAYERYQRGSAERLIRKGEPQWEVRFAPAELGKHTCTVTVRDRTGTVTAKPVEFACVAGGGKGFVRRSPQTPYYLQFDSGDPYFAIGHNICWAGRSAQTYDYDKWLPALGKAGGNYTRLWLVRWNMGLEWSPQDPDGGNEFPGLGKYSLTNAWRLDHVLDVARQSGVYAMLCLGFHGELMDTEDYFKADRWRFNPYNAAMGGPCSKPADFWSDPPAQKLYQRRLRYYIARYGCFTNVLSWEFWNEVNAPVQWVKPMAEYLAAHDPYRHLVTTTYGTDDVWRVKEIDYSQTHKYGSDTSLHDCTDAIARDSRTFTEKFAKPYMMGEFGIDWKSSDTQHDPRNVGTNLHNGLWASVMQRSFGTAALWYWENYMHDRGNYHHLTAVKRFTDTVPWNKLNFRLARFSAPTVQVAHGAPWADFRFHGKLGWAKGTGTDFTLNHDSTIDGDGDFSALLFADSKPDLKSPLRFHVDLPTPAKFGLHVGVVSNTAVLHLRLDGGELWTQEFVAGEGVGATSKFYPEWGLWQSDFNQDCEVDLPAGKHVIELENTGKDHVTLPELWLTGYLDPRYARIDTLGLYTDDLALLWLHDQNSNWFNDSQGQQPGLATKLTCDLLGLPAGNYKVQWWNTWKGEVLEEAAAKCTDGRLPLSPPDFARDLAAKVTRVGTGM